MLSHYRLVEKIGAGGMGVVYRARDLHLERDVAIKVLPAGTLTDPATRARFRKEALALSKLNHPAIATVFDFDTQDSIDFLVMEYVPGTSLDEKLAEDALEESEIVALSTQLADGLATAHTQGIVHRDLKPANLRVMPDGRLKILDFGLAKLFKPGGATATAETQTGGIVGTVPYMAPEQLSGGRIDTRTDVYATGNVLYEMTTGQRPHSETDMARLMYAIAHETPPSPRSSNPRISPALDAVIRKAMEKDPERRYQSARGLVDDLRRLQAGLRVTAPKRRAGRGLRWGLRLMVASFVLLAVLLSFDVGGLRRLLLGGAGETRIASLAVLPLKNLSGDPEQAYFVDGMTEALITDLSRIGELKVISRSSAMRYKATDKPLSEIARELNVDAFVEGSVVREGDRVGITAQLIEAATETNLWAERYEREIASILTLQGEVAQAIAREIQVKLTPVEEALLTRNREVDPEAYAAYLKGQSHFHNLTPAHLDAARHYFERALEEDPDYAPAHAGISLVWAARQQFGLTPPDEAGPKAKAAAQKAVELDDSVAEAHYALAIVRTWTDWDWEGAETAFRRAIELKPNFADVRAYYSHYLMITQRPEEAIKQMERAMELDPYNALFPLLNSILLEGTDRCEEALDFYRNTLQTAPNDPEVLGGVVRAYYCLGMYEETYEAAVANQTGRGRPEAVAALEAGYADGGFTGAMSALAQWKEEQLGYCSSFNLAAAGKNREALDCLELHFEEFNPDMPYISVQVDYRTLRNEPRFQELLRRLNLPTP
jgi:serine/threonine-protein kinase